MKIIVYTLLMITLLFLQKGFYLYCRKLIKIMLYFSWVLLSIFVGAIGISRTIGFFGAFMISLLLTPVVGFIFTMISKDKETAMLEKQQLRHTGNFQRYGSYKEKGNYKVAILAVILLAIFIALIVFFINMYT
jgi:Ca2+/Na+ antiporter